MFKNLSSYIECLEKEGELLRISVAVDTDKEIAEITDRQSKSPGGGKALLFENTGTPFAVLTNMLGSSKRIALALGVESLDELPQRIHTFFAKAMAPKNGLIDKLKMVPMVGEVGRWMPKKSRGFGECQEVVHMGENADLYFLPILKCAPFDGAPFITLPLVNTISPETGARNVGMYRMQVFGSNTTGMHWHRHKTGDRHFEAYKKLGQVMAVSVALGGDPAYTYAATAPLPEGIDEYMLAGFIRNKPVELVKCLTNDIYVPRDCDFIIEGYVDPTEQKVVEGAFGDHTGFYSLEDFYPVFHVTCITHRREAIYPATIVGVPPMEDAYIAEATEKIFLAPIQLVASPDITDMHMPTAGVAHNIAIMDIAKNYPGQAFKVASGMWGAGQMMFNKFMVVTSGLAGGLTDAENIKAQLKKVVVGRDIIFSRGPLDILDHSAPVAGFGGKMCIDATEKLVEEGSDSTCSNIPSAAKFSLVLGVASISDRLVRDGWNVLLLELEGGAQYREVANLFAAQNSMDGVQAVLMFDKERLPSSDYLLLWLSAGNTDPMRDIYIIENTLFADCRAKLGGINGFNRRWPNIVCMDDKTILKVDGRWQELGIGEFIVSPSLRLKRFIYPFNAGSNE